MSDVPAYPSKATLAHQLDVAESTIDELVRRGILPRPRKLTSGCIRWSWREVEMALDSLKGTEGGDPYMAGITKLGEGENGEKGKSGN